ncbi:DUF2269 domain-containing protein [Lysobacter niastensis]|uniref:DUF2269 domain-containing protein n=1 Tax=Lysobacter niastensis TaxID=380629 RepID=A0ABS0B8E8_9GAMM|nr:DUF2269 domain-containing protein [Lysobacter niastensis]
MTTYLVVKWIHVLSSVVLVGTGFGTAFYLFFANRSGNLQAQAVVARLVVRADWWFTTPAVLIQPASGLRLHAVVALRLHRRQRTDQAAGAAGVLHRPGRLPGAGTQAGRNLRRPSPEHVARHRAQRVRGNRWRHVLRRRCRHHDPAAARHRPDGQPVPLLAGAVRPVQRRLPAVRRQPRCAQRDPVGRVPLLRAGTEKRGQGHLPS